MSWVIEENSFDKNRVELNGNRFLTGNGYMGYRGTLEEFTKEQLVGCLLPGVYDKVGDKWREPVNAPNGLFTRVGCDSVKLSALSENVVSHRQTLDISKALHSRETVFQAGENRIRINSERFLSLTDIHLVCMKYSVEASRDCRLTIETGIDADVWDINGPHLEDVKAFEDDGCICVTALSHEMKYRVAAAECIRGDFGAGDSGAGDGSAISISGDGSAIRVLEFNAKAGARYTFCKYFSVYTSRDNVSDTAASAQESCRRAAGRGYDAVLADDALFWAKRWSASDVKIEGDDEAQTALRYSLYHLLIIAPLHSERLSIPARGLSGQVYKGAVFWDTEMFMLPFYIHSDAKTARNLVMYRCHTLDGARRKAAEYGYRGAFFAWESQDTGDDACTNFAVTDVFTNRPLRTYFRDKQIHISADVVYGIMQYMSLTGDYGILREGAAEVILECARFFYSYSCFKKDRNRYEMLDVVGPDEYHERVYNNAFTNAMTAFVLDSALAVLERLEKSSPEYLQTVLDKLDYYKDVADITEMRANLHLKQPDPESLVIEQFDGYHRLEDISVAALKERILNKNEYMGTASGIAFNTQVLKQADVMLMLYLFKNKFGNEVIKANWEHYEPRTEHGSSLSACIYALTACETGKSDWAYPYFMKTASIDLTGDSKHYVGTLYIGGTHPAANGGAWMAAVFGFAGVCAGEGKIRIVPRLPAKWTSIEFPFACLGQSFKIFIDRKSVKITAQPGNTQGCCFEIKGEKHVCQPGQELRAGLS